MRSRRRGSFIVLVVGTLAMLSIIMIVYVAVGNSDKRASVSITRRDKSEEIIAAFSDYVSQIIADDAVTLISDASNLTPDGNNLSNLPGGLFYLREGWDAPVTSWQADSTVGPTTEVSGLPSPRVFRPVGLGDDPWLASTTPVWLNFNPGSITSTIDGQAKTFRNRRDWLHITNIAPDGRFVNLFNLRNNYNALPGTGNDRMSRDVSLPDINGAEPTAPLFGGTLNQDLPSTFDSWQAGAFTPARGPFVRSATPITAADRFHPLYQWADADGDGWLDSRWFELTDARGENGQNPASFRSLLPADPNLRWFFAARIIDLSSLINVNTAGDMAKDPNQNPVDFTTSVRKTDVVGLSPSDVDLRRLFLMGDANETVLNGDVIPAAFRIGDVSLTGAANTGDLYVGGYGNIRQPVAGYEVMQDYRQYVPSLPTGLTSPYGTWTPAIITPALDLGEGGYRALRGGLGGGSPPSRFANFSEDPLKTLAVNFAEIRDRQTYFNTSGGLLSRPVYDSDTSRFNFGTGFRLDSLVELLTYRGVNDPAVTSALEMAVGGRLPSTFSTAPKPPPNDGPPVPFSPLRDNRSLQLEREGLTIVEPSGQRGTPTDAALLKSFTDVRQYLTTQSGARPLASSFYRPNSGQTVSFEYPPELVNTVKSLTDEPSLNLRSDLTHYILKGAEKNVDKTIPTAPVKYVGVPLAETLFAGYAAALMPAFPAGMTEDAAAGLENAWNDPATDATAASLRGLFYGHQGPVTALLAAGHMTANFMSNFQEPYRDLEVSPNADLFYRDAHLPYTLILSEQALAGTFLPESPRMPSGSGIAPDTNWKEYFPAWWASWRSQPKSSASAANQAFPTHQLNLARTQAEKALASDTRPMPRLATTSAQTPVPAVNIYGISDVHPFLVEVASFTVYRDVPPGGIAPTDNESILGDMETDVRHPLAPDPNTQSLVTVNGNVTDPKNPDLMFQAVAVKIQNPHPVPISLSKLTTDGANYATSGGTPFRVNEKSDFYLQIGATPDSTKPEETTFFALAEVVESHTAEYDGNYSVKPVTIMPGETIVFYALNRDAKSIVENKLGWWDRNLKSNASDKVAVTLTNWLEKQIGPMNAPVENGFRRVQMLRVDDNFISKAVPTPDSFASTKFSRLFPNVDNPTSPGVLDQTVVLKRVIHADSRSLANDSISDNGVVPNNSIWNDAVCDRLRLGKLIGLNRRLRLGPPDSQTANNDGLVILGLPVPFGFTAQQYDPPSGTVDDGNYNRRFSVTIGVSVRRQGDPAGSTLKPGAIPAWAIDPKDADPRTWYDVKYVPAKYMDPYHPIALTSSDLSTTEGNGVTFWGYTPRNWRTAQDTPLFSNLSKPANESDHTGFPALNKRNLSLAEIRRELSGNPFQYQGVAASGNPTMVPDHISQIRPTDLLNTLAVGTIETPLDRNGTEITDPFKRWTTTAEMFAIAMNYTQAPASPGSWETAQVAGSLSCYGPLDYYYFYTPPVGQPQKQLFDGGYLRTDDFVSVRFDTAHKPYTVGTGAPIAGNVLSTFRMNKDALGSLTSPTAGLININTAPQAVLRTLPFTFPAKDYTSTSTNAFWVGLTEQEAKKTDVAAMIESYRDKFAVELRKEARAHNAQQSWFAGFFDRNRPQITQNGDQNVQPTNLTIGDYSGILSSYSGGRYWTNGILGIREGAGFRSVGELLAVRHVKMDQATGLPSATPELDLPNNIDFLGYRNLDQPTNLIGTDNNVRTIGTLDPAKGSFTVTDVLPLEVGHTYQDKLKILSGLLGSVTVRSDMYAVWFIARGYQRSDCEGLPDLQPMVPTVERRFLMIIDRSNVTKIGQKPRVLAFVEVPL